MATLTPPANSAFLAPRYWPTWLGIALLCLISWLPFRLRMAFGALLGWLTWLLGRERRYITSVNIALCFPELDQQQQQKLVREIFIENGRGLIETAGGWIRPAAHFRHMVQLQGADEFRKALDAGRGILLLGAHYSMLDFGANLLSLHFPFAVTYRPHKNPLFDAFMLRGRISNCNGVFDRSDIRGAFRHLKQGKIVWYAPDQDYGPEHSVFAPFFGIPAATITAASRFARINDSAVFMVSQRRNTRDKTYILEFTRVSRDFPSDDDVADAHLINLLLEQQIRKSPAQYMWMHKRFKTRPGGKPESPYIHIRTPNRKLSADRYAELTRDAEPLENRDDRLLLGSGLQLRLYPGLASGLRRFSHPASRVDRLSKNLRDKGIATVTVDSIFRMPHLSATGITLFVPDGVSAGIQQPEASSLAELLLALHSCGCSFINIAPDLLLWTGTALAVNDPLALRQYPGSTALDWRVADLIGWQQALRYDAEQQKLLGQYYLQNTVWHERPMLEEKLAAATAHPHNAD